MTKDELLEDAARIMLLLKTHANGHHELWAAAMDEAERWGTRYEKANAAATNAGRPVGLPEWAAVREDGGVEWWPDGGAKHRARWNPRAKVIVCQYHTAECWEDCPCPEWAARHLLTQAEGARPHWYTGHEDPPERPAGTTFADGLRYAARFIRAVKGPAWLEDGARVLEMMAEAEPAPKPPHRLDQPDIVALHAAEQGRENQRLRAETAERALTLAEEQKTIARAERDRALEHAAKMERERDSAREARRLDREALTKRVEAAEARVTELEQAVIDAKAEGYQMAVDAAREYPEQGASVPQLVDYLANYHEGRPGAGKGQGR